MDILSSIGLSELIWKIKTSFISKSETTPVQSIAIDTTPTQDSANLITSGGVYDAIPEAITEQTVAGWGFTKNTGTYSKPSTGIPKTDLASGVQSSLGKADSAVQPSAISDMASRTWVGQGFPTKAELQDVEAEIPHAVSDLQNDEGYQTEEQVSEAVAAETERAASIENQILGNVLEEVARAKEREDEIEEAIPTKTSDLTNDSGFLTAHQSLALAITALSSNPSSIALDSSAARTYQTCAITTQTSITLSGGNDNAGFEHYILFHNSGSADCVVTPASGMIAPSSITVKAGKYLELSYIYTGANVVITNSTEIG